MKSTAYGNVYNSIENIINNYASSFIVLPFYHHRVITVGTDVSSLSSKLPLSQAIVLVEEDMEDDQEGTVTASA